MFQAASARSMSNEKLATVQLDRPYGHDGSSIRGTIQQHRVVTCYEVDADAMANEDERFGVRVHPGGALRVIEHRSVRDDHSRGPAVDERKLHAHALPCDQA